MSQTNLQSDIAAVLTQHIKKLQKLYHKSKLINYEQFSSLPISIIHKEDGFYLNSKHRDDVKIFPLDNCIYGYESIFSYLKYYYLKFNIEYLYNNISHYDIFDILKAYAKEYSKHDKECPCEYTFSQYTTKETGKWKDNIVVLVNHSGCKFTEILYPQDYDYKSLDNFLENCYNRTM